jgi:hypothetical protein
MPWETNTSMTFDWRFPLAGFNENRNTDNVLEHGLPAAVELLDFHAGWGSFN